MRAFTDPVILSTLPHILSIAYISGCIGKGAAYDIYAGIICISSSLSIAWHIHREPRNMLFYLDYIFALAWSIGDIVMAPLLQSMLLNLCVLSANLLSDYLAKKGIIPYDIGHSIWHVMSSAKSIYISYLVRYYCDGCHPNLQSYSIHLIE